jgi:hypothetical protein
MTQESRNVVNRAARQTAKQVLRRYGEATADLRPGPDFVIIGAKRGGTTSLHNYLREHPSIRPLFPGRRHIKGIHYYDSNYASGLRWYRSYFPLQAGGRHLARPDLSPAIAGESSPYYLLDPIDRAYSHYKEAIHHGRETLSFEAALEAEDERLRGEAERIVAEPGYLSVSHEHLSYLAQSRYLDVLPRWFSLFPREQFHILASEDFYADPDHHVNEIWRFLGLPPRQMLSRTRHNHQPAPDIRPETRQRLQEALADHNQGLEELLGRRLPWPATKQPIR